MRTFEARFRNGSRRFIYGYDMAAAISSLGAEASEIVRCAESGYWNVE